MRPLLCVVAVVVLFSSQAEVALSKQDSLINSQALSLTATDGFRQSVARRAARRRVRHNRKPGKSMQKAAAPKTPVNDAVLDSPNRMEIDPGDIPPGNRPRDPNVDDRTRIPSDISPDDISPRPKPKKKRP
jgi:hypothetical protein